MNDPISSIDAENIEKNVTDSYKAMHKAIKQFAEFESNKTSFDSYTLNSILTINLNHNHFFTNTNYNKSNKSILRRSKRPLLWWRLAMYLILFYVQIEINMCG